MSRAPSEKQQITPDPGLSMLPRPDGPRGRAAIAVVAGILVTASLAVWVARGRAHGAATPPVARDVPFMEGGRIVLSRGFRERAGVAFTALALAPFKPSVRVVGTVSLNPTHVAAIGTRLRGTVRRTFKVEGDAVRANEALAEVESAELGEAQSRIAQAQASFNAAELHARREKELLEKGLTTAREAEVATSELAQERASLQSAEQRVRALGGLGEFGTFVVRSPIAGHVIERHLSPGQSVEGNAVGFKVADLDHLWVELSVFERDLGFVKLDDDVEVSPLADPGVKLPGKVAHVGELIDPATRSAEVRLAVDFPKFHLRPGQSVHATITSASVQREALLVPHTAVVFVDGKATVFVADDDTHVRAAPVTLGASDGTHHEVLEGVSPGQRVATGGVFALKSELFR